MSKEKTSALVFFKGKRAGILSRTPEGYEFCYDGGYLKTPGSRPISLSLPLREEKYVSKNLPSFFDGLLPEGWLLEIESRAAKIDKEDKFKMLLHTGTDPVGAVSLSPIEEETK